MPAEPAVVSSSFPTRLAPYLAQTALALRGLKFKQQFEVDMAKVVGIDGAKYSQNKIEIPKMFADEIARIEGLFDKVEFAPGTTERFDCPAETIVTAMDWNEERREFVVASLCCWFCNELDIKADESPLETLVWRERPHIYIDTVGRMVLRARLWIDY